MLAFGLGVMFSVYVKVCDPVLPLFETMGVVGGCALAANLACFVLLFRHRGDGLNMNSTWLCSRNDLIANAGVLAAAGVGYAFASPWPDILVGGGIASLFLVSACGVLTQSVRALQA